MRQWPGKFWQVDLYRPIKYIGRDGFSNVQAPQGRGKGKNNVGVGSCGIEFVAMSLGVSMHT
jgi:hypothetical protein